MNYQHLKYFQVLAREENFQRASAKLFVTQPALSRAISNLESELGVELFDKTKQGTKITPCGMVFLKYVDKAIENIEQGVDAIRFMTGKLEGIIRIACVYGYVYRYLPKLIRSFTEKYPNIRFEILLGPTYDVMERLNDETADVGFHLETPQMKKFPNLDFKTIHREDIVIAVPKSWPLSEKKSCHLADLAKMRLISFGFNSGIIYKTQALFKSVGLDYIPYITANDDQSVLNIVRNGIGAAIVMRNIVRSDDPDISIVEIADHVDKSINICIAMKQRTNFSTIVTSFVDFVLNEA